MELSQQKEQLRKRLVQKVVQGHNSQIHWDQLERDRE